MRFRQPQQQKQTTKQQHSLFPIPTNTTTPSTNNNVNYSTEIVQQSLLANNTKVNELNSNQNQNYRSKIISLIENNEDCFYDNIQVIVMSKISIIT